jgi:hypothetical protein
LNELPNLDLLNQPRPAFQFSVGSFDTFSIIRLSRVLFAGSSFNPI